MRVSNGGRRAAGAVGVVVLVGALLVAGVVGARALVRPTASDLIPLDSAGPSLPVVTGPTLHVTGSAISGNPSTRLGWASVNLENQGKDPVTISGIRTETGAHDVRAVLVGLVPEDGSQQAIDTATVPAQLDLPGVTSLVVPPNRGASLLVGFTAGCDSTDSGFAPTVTLAVTSPSAGSGVVHVDPTDANWLSTALDYACTPAPTPTPTP